MTGHYAMIPMEEYNEYMKWKQDKRSEELRERKGVRRIPVPVDEDIPF